MLKKIFAALILVFSLVAIPVQMPGMIAGFCYWSCAFDATAASDQPEVREILFAMCVSSEC